MFIPTKQKIDKLLQFLKRKTNYRQNAQFRGEYANGRTDERDKNAPYNQ